MTPCTFIFDFDGTLADTTETIWLILHRVAPEFGLSHLSREDFDNARRLPDGLTGSAMRRKYSISWWKLFRIMKRVRDEQRRVLAQIPLPHGLGDVLAELQRRGYLLGVLTTNRATTVRSFVAYHALPTFRFVASASDLLGKAGALQRLLRRERIDPHTAILVGDEVGDITAGKKAGVRTVAVTWGFHTELLLAQYQPDRIVRHPHELLFACENFTM